MDGVRERNVVNLEVVGELEAPKRGTSQGATYRVEREQTNHSVPLYSLTMIKLQLLCKPAS